MFRGRSPSGNDRPAGLKDHPLGSRTFGALGLLVGNCALQVEPTITAYIRMSN
ncbi:hypothetical protein ADIARSV_3794 [Arcticibacter svalbardensis MN12-7]|uniref:Uncharacterized protein n=1 Tax=Arcticibacter svalbardensis MN12-7 TaxID=1150600 RepID=R9GMT3_9SPHI|nr:hypothetical protein ADIARSV_3794 [Arcticibacter svalbardensis MN12-7]